MHTLSVGIDLDDTGRGTRFFIFIKPEITRDSTQIGVCRQQQSNDDGAHYLEDGRCASFRTSVDHDRRK